ncbi:MAG: Nif11-like leader peptide family natural product precursor [Hydrococcus sp. Prado102]|jgi:predicted ribosomally synthesized peptide with nif11-like leader|nr:Nif11-like leader peptide family natural product precursor [Hydrococcus sp. Prado102]
MSLENVKAFYQKLAKDEAFRSQIQGAKNKEECSQIVKTAGFNFTQQEYEEYTTQLLESDPNDSELKDLSEKELEAVFGGTTTIIGSKWLNPDPQHFYMMYGVVTPPEVI